MRASGPFGRYQNLFHDVSKSDDLLDIAFGMGGGLVPLRDATNSILGVDTNPLSIRKAAAQHSNFSHVRFICDDETSIPIRFFRDLERHLLPGGKRIIEVPKLFDFPLGEPLLPVHGFEFRSGEVEELLNRVGL